LLSPPTGAPPDMARDNADLGAPVSAIAREANDCRLDCRLEFLVRPKPHLLAGLDLTGLASRRVRPVRAARVLTSRMPRPLMRIRLPCFRCVVIAVTKAANGPAFSAAHVPRRAAQTPPSASQQARRRPSPWGRSLGLRACRHDGGFIRHHLAISRLGVPDNGSCQPPGHVLSSNSQRRRTVHAPISTSPRCRGARNTRYRAARYALPGRGFRPLDHASLPGAPCGDPSSSGHRVARRPSTVHSCGQVPCKRSRTPIGWALIPALRCGRVWSEHQRVHATDAASRNRADNPMACWQAP
jgi:hypothetical protein